MSVFCSTARHCSAGETVSRCSNMALGIDSNEVHIEGRGFTSPLDEKIEAFPAERPCDSSASARARSCDAPVPFDHHRPLMPTEEVGRRQRTSTFSSTARPPLPQQQILQGPASQTSVAARNTRLESIASRSSAQTAGVEENEGWRRLEDAIAEATPIQIARLRNLLDGASPKHLLALHDANISHASASRGANDDRSELFAGQADDGSRLVPGRALRDPNGSFPVHSSQVGTANRAQQPLQGDAYDRSQLPLLGKGLGDRLTPLPSVPEGGYSTSADAGKSRQNSCSPRWMSEISVCGLRNKEAVRPSGD